MIPNASPGEYILFFAGLAPAFYLIKRECLRAMCATWEQYFESDLFGGFSWKILIKFNHMKPSRITLHLRPVGFFLGLFQPGPDEIGF